ncbi:divalent metal cation transporter FieF [Endozoicomonas sp. OPT23]|uniref:cation diffusion facilitator family transporter n=1 Tax=Endozoicomonas sp. OPT23 TaxID=2072845 RepID=UPI00129BB110|nr:cation diffusion facilitator family transporter [Endozoicomonas sp. OPT23]MRI34154.1 divalent metal cation transporter FieF [Endozoicomonas sp. OPT23]
MPQTNTLDQANHERLMKLASRASVFTAATLIIVKLVAWFMTGSLSVLATLLDSVMDIIASVITLVAVRIALAPADAEHRFGHGKAEYLAVLAQSMFICGSAIILFLSAIDQLLAGESHLENEAVGLYVMLFSIVATLALLTIQSYVVKRTGSAAIAADSMHYKVDLLTNITVIGALIGASYGYFYFDAGFALIISVYMLASVGKMAWDATQQLMDHSLPEEQVKEIEQIVMSVEGIRGIHEMRTRISGRVPFIQMHLDLNGDLPLRTAHDLGQIAEDRILAYLPTADIIIHLDPD